MSSNSPLRIISISLRGDRLKAAREQNGFSQQELAQLCGFGPNQISRYENGLNEPSALAVGLLAYTLDVSIDYLMGLSDVPQSAAYQGLSREQRKLIEAYEIGDNLTLLELVTARLKALAGKE